MSLAARKIRLIMNLRRAGITDLAVLGAMERVPREAFVLPHFHDQAYEDQALPIAQGQTISQPQIVATMTEALQVTKSHKVLEIGTGSGYQTAVLSKLARRVYTIERFKSLLDEAGRASSISGCTTSPRNARTAARVGRSRRPSTASS
jgi:protein-L-isoaspartate(D-aspartate) O-methyltransferase